MGGGYPHLPRAQRGIGPTKAESLVGQSRRAKLARPDEGVRAYVILLPDGFEETRPACA
jgi:hypothetical protein